MPRGSGPIDRPKGSTNANKHNAGGSRANSGRKKKIVTAAIGTSKLSTFFTVNNSSENASEGSNHSDHESERAEKKVQSDIDHELAQAENSKILENLHKACEIDSTSAEMLEEQMNEYLSDSEDEEDASEVESNSSSYNSSNSTRKVWSCMPH